jgi:phosphatidylserine decarboxylase
MNSSTRTILAYKIMPKSMLSRAFGALTRVRMPRGFLRRFIAWYSAKFGVNASEYVEPAGGFRTINEFFTRKLKDGARPVDPDIRSVVSPVDARVDQYGHIDAERLIQAKGIDYRLSDLVPSEMHRHFLDGEFITLYLSPGDYHRIHSPVKGTIEGFYHVPGKLFTVKESMVQALPDLFSINERLISYVRAPGGMVAVCKVGATNVGRISLSYDTVITNKTFRSRKERLYSDGGKKEIDRGGELGTFNLGSTVVLLFAKGMIRFEPLALGSKVKMGQRIAALLR